MKDSRWQLLRPVAARHRRELHSIAAWSLLGALPVLLSGRLVAHAVDHGFLADDAVTGFLTLGGYGAALAVGSFAAWRAMAPMAIVAEAVRDHLVRTTVSGGLRRAVAGGVSAGGESVTALTSQTENARQILAALLMSAPSTGLTAAAALVGVVSLAPVSGLLALLPALTVGVVVVRLSRSWRLRYSASLAADEHMTEQIAQRVQGLRDVVACGATRRAREDTDHAVDAQADAAAAVARASGARVGAVALGARLPLIALLVTAPWLSAQGALTPGELVGAVTYLVSSLEPALRSLVQSVGNLALELGTVLARLTEYHREPKPGRVAESAPGTGTDGRCRRRPAAPEPVPPDIELTLRAVTFRRGEGTDPPVLDRVCVTLPAGGHLAVVGPSGAGKSTLADLVCGLERPESGQVLLGGVPLPDLDPAWLRRSIALVPQEAYVFAGTVRDNLGYLAPEADDDRLDRAIEALDITALLAELGGYDGELRRPDLLSPAQRQLLTLARVYLSPARIVILDEATCHLGIAAEQRVERAFAQRGGTLVVIAHRMPSAARAQQVLVVDAGTVHSGTHRELLRTCATYADLVGHWGETGAPP
ncbi:ABC transporter ATP-binding protein [Streptomyces leeuwenhoekii]|uniref:ABC transporter ATP-binding protein n=1 Tax=Streptomyces leeuwenhoekii TaxID=1437453 RepID=UPI00069E4154|nr:ABC transporter ATP-binding protein [Streptomyces leeuwenhoekii]